ncbi:MAG TPA: hypothetical protein PLU24_00980 [Candidatus Omnitrophota bacterium]|nr:hypothetical protein [Candidatus Omnitrophota bacterium]
MTKMVMIVYNEAIDLEVFDILKEIPLNNYTKVNGAYGSGKTSGIHLGNDIWPGLNNVLFISCQEKEAVQLITSIKRLRQQFGQEGVKAFVLPVEDLT